MVLSGLTWRLPRAFIRAETETAWVSCEMGANSGSVFTSEKRVNQCISDLLPRVRLSKRVSGDVAEWSKALPC